MRSGVSSSFLVRFDVSGSGVQPWQEGIGTNKNEINIVVFSRLQKTALESTRKVPAEGTPNRYGARSALRGSRPTGHGRGPRSYPWDASANLPEAT